MLRVHFIGIGGVGMNGLAQLAALSNYAVSGSDRGYDPEMDPFKTLERLGIDIQPQDGSSITSTVDRVVYSSAIEADNPDLVRARGLKIPKLHRADFLNELIGDDQLIAVAGTAGKTTTTGLLGWIFESLGKDPSVYNGAGVVNWRRTTAPGNVRKGNSKLWIIEADESDRSLLKFHPTHAIITNISRDHFELDELHALFNQFENQTSEITVRGSSFSAVEFLQSQINQRDFPMIGKHNLENAGCAARLCHELGMDMELVMDAISRFKGIERRLELIGNPDGITIIDDYAHNPAKIEAALAALPQHISDVHAYWRPHGFSPLYQCQDDLIQVFKRAQLKSLFILPVYYAGGTVERKTDSEEFVGRLNSCGIEAKLVPDYAMLERELKQCACTGDLILGMGARDPELPQFTKRLAAEWKTS
jgi:UDP-N-acetylmuramate--alanine ligase